MFATGVENSYPTVGRRRVDEMAKCRHYERWRDDFDCVQDLGIHVLRYGPPLHRTWLGPGRYDWEFADLTFGELLRRDITPMADLCHFGVPDWLGDFQNPDFPELFADYARVFAQRFPWVQLFTPVNEMFVCATFSAAYGWWNEQLTSDRGFVTALKHLVKANVLAMQAILESCPNAIFIQSESSEYFHADSPEAIKPAEIANSKRFLPPHSRGASNPRRARQLEALPAARPQLRQARRLGDVRVPRRQRHDPRRVPFLSRQPPQAALRHGQ